MQQRAPAWQRVSDAGLKATYVGTLILLLACAAITLQGMRDTASSSVWVEHTYLVLSKLEGTLSKINQTQSVARAFVIGGDPKLVVEYKRFRDDTVREALELENLTSDSPVQQLNVKVLKGLVTKKLASMDSGIAKRSRPGMSADKMSHSVSAGQDLLEKVERQIGVMKDEEHRLLQIRLNRTSSLARLSTYFFGATAIFAVLLLTGVFNLVVRLNRSFSKTQEQQILYSEQLEQEVQRTAAARKELERSNRELQDFAFVASHDLQEPLRKIRSYGDRLLRRLGADLDEASQSDLTRMQSAAERMQGLINDILTLSRVTAKTHPFTNVDLNTVFSEVLDDLETRVQQSGATVTKGSLPVVYADAMQMRQLLQNLMGNGLKFLRPEEPGRIMVEPLPKPSKGFVGFSVRDNGIGFEEKHAEKIFTVFQRLHNRTSYEGSGVGLSICRRIVERHGGTIEARGVPGEGATFLITLPEAQKGTTNQ